MNTKPVAVGELFGGHMLTRWGRQLDPENVLPEYPRPQLVRPNWASLNGRWDYAITERSASPPEKFDGQIIVPFPIESQLSGVTRRVLPTQQIWYRRRFIAPRIEPNGRTLLHFGAVDWQCDAIVNGTPVGQHQGGYDPFSFDITGALTNSDEQELLVCVWDPNDAGIQPRGKQALNPRNIWYTSITGIWQTVWLEPVPAISIRRLKITPDVDAGVVRVLADLSGPGKDLSLTVLDSTGIVIAKGRADSVLQFEVHSPKLWSPDDPFLYDIKVRLGRDTEILDEVSSYFAMRSISVKIGADGIRRMLLNGNPVFQLGPLDQGFWPDGLYTAPTDEALRFDIETMKQFGFNMVRKHVKVEPERWYYWCDRLGLLVWQDMPSGMIDCTPLHAISPETPDAVFTLEEQAGFKRELLAMMDSLHNHPCIVVWVPFNEGWGQHCSSDVLKWVKDHDPSRLVDGPSGWTDRGVGDLHDMHAYPGPDMFPAHPTRVSVLGEFGGLGLPPSEGHLWWTKENWSYATYSQSELQEKYNQLFLKLIPLIERGLCAAVYTQLTDVEGEINGLLTYDREITKFDHVELTQIHNRIIRNT
jgi:beta-galactosidase/beta-glucuronidase